MQTKRPSQLISGNAYRIFRTELQRYLEHASEFFEVQDVDECPETLRKLGASFHTVKGGAGFLGFQDIASCAGELEKLLLKSSGNMLEKLDSVRSLIVELEEMAKKLPEPRALSDGERAA